MNESTTRDLVRSLTNDLEVNPPPVTATIARGRQVRARRRLAAGGVVAAVTAGILASAGLLALDHGPEDVIAPAPVVAPDHVWWAEGTVHLAGGPVPVAAVRELVEVPGGAVVLTEAGEVLLFDDDGTHEAIGRWRTGTPQEDVFPTVRAEDDGTVVWLDGTTRPRHSLVVYDPVAGAVVARHQIPTGGFHDAAHLNEFEDGVVVWDAGSYGQRAWDVAADTVTRIGTGATLLIALEDGIAVTYNDAGDGVEVGTGTGTEPLWQSADDGGYLSADGSTVVTLSGPPTRLKVRDARTGREVAGAIDLATGPLAVHLDGARALTYVVGTPTPDAVVAPYELVVCDLVADRCTVVVQDAAEPPVVPHD